MWGLCICIWISCIVVPAGHFWGKVYHRDIVPAAFSHLRYPFGKKKKKKNQFVNGTVLEELRRQKKFWCPDTTFWIIFDFFFLAISEIANNRCLNSSQVKNSNWFQKKLDWILASVWHLWKYKHMQRPHFQLHSKTVLKKNPNQKQKFWNCWFKRKIFKIYRHFS